MKITHRIVDKSYYCMQYNWWVILTPEKQSFTLVVWNAWEGARTDQNLPRNWIAI